MNIYQTENSRHRQFGAVGSGVGSPKGLGTAANKPLMQKLRAPLGAAAKVILPRTNLLPAAARRPLGTLHDLGTVRQWTTELAGFAVLVVAFVVSLILI